tara:strand:- start:3398 stop:4270 length:873 start_codon:yes stop_codon:yes gene_type:complete
LRDFTADFIKELSFQEVLNLHKLNFEKKKDIKIQKKTSESIIREFDSQKYKLLLDIIEKDKNATLETIEKAEDGNKSIDIFFKNKHFLAKSNCLRNAIKHTFTDSLRFLKSRSQYESIIEFGCGYGSKILSIMKNEHKNYKYYAVDISYNGLKILVELAKRNNLSIQTIKHDFHTNNLLSLSFPRSLLITSYNLHYWKEFTFKDIKNIMKIGIISGIHIEPCSDLIYKNKNINERYNKLSLEYIIKNGYTQNIGNAFIKAEKEGLINLDISNYFIGSGFLPASIIKWWIK